MLTIMVLMAISCPNPKMQNVTKFAWNDFDKSILEQARKRCGELYPDAPCVKLFRKYGKQDYSVICGAKR